MMDEKVMRLAIRPWLRGYITDTVSPGRLCIVDGLEDIFVND